MNRREFLELATMSTGAALAGGCKCPFCGPRERVPYDETIGDRLWMWGHHRDSFKALKGRKEGYNLPYETRIDMAAACKDMNIPGCFVVRWTDNPKKAELPEYMKQFNDTKRVGFSITDSAVESFDVKLGVVLYSDANEVRAEFKDVLDLCDEITFWFWHGKNVGTIESQVAKLKNLVGADKPILLGQYMYDFGGRKQMPGKDMETQLAATSRLLSQKAIDGVIFHCTPLVDMNLDAVNVSRAWIRENASKKWGM